MGFRYLDVSSDLDLNFRLSNLKVDRKHPDAHISHPFNRPISHTPVIPVQQSVCIFGWQAFSYLLPPILQDIILICLKPSLILV